MSNVKNYIKRYSRGLGIVVGDAVRFRSGDGTVLLVAGIHTTGKHHDWLTLVGDWPGSGQAFASYRFEVINASR
jgi:hypothetical protein